ncbi:MAG: hypothetical protein ACR2QM_13370 [Longimicrobiales bacterium]
MARTPSSTLRVYLECSTFGCDQREFRTQISWVDWMRDRTDASVHILVTSQQTGSGGREYQLDFIGLADLAGEDDQLTYTSLGTDVRDETVQGLTSVLSVGIARYSVLAGSLETFSVTTPDEDPPTDRLVASTQVDDPWDFWVFEIDLNADLSGESSRSERRLRGGIEASRTTPEWKIQFEADGSWREDEITLSDTTIVDTRRDWDIEVGVGYALADHWSLGGQGDVAAATRTNQDLSISIGPALEYSVWPYVEAPRRSLVAVYSVGLRYFNYEEETLFGHLSETRPAHRAELNLSQRQPWGRVFAGMDASQFLHDPSKYRLGVGGFISFRLVRGFSINLDGGASWIRDQLFLSASGATDEEILLERRRLASDFDWEFGIGFSYQFGSIFNNVVNNRFPR